jgi:hypothetical protein
MTPIILSERSPHQNKTGSAERMFYPCLGRDGSTGKSMMKTKEDRYEERKDKFQGMVRIGSGALFDGDTRLGQ